MKQEILSKLLSKALQLWLRSQVSHVNTLELTIHGTNQQLLSGEIPQIDLLASQVLYQDLHLSKINLKGKNIKINLQQIFQGKPIKLLEPIPLNGSLTLTASDLQASLTAPLLATALTDLLQTLLKNHQDIQIPQQIHWQQVAILPRNAEAIETNYLKLVGSYSVANSWQSSSKSAPEALIAPSPSVINPVIDPDVAPEIKMVSLETGLTLAQPHQLCLTPLSINFSDEIGTIALESFILDLGEDVAIQELLLAAGQLTCHGKLTVQP